MQHSDHAARTSFSDHCPGIVLRIARVNYNRFPQLARESELPGKCSSLLETRGVIVVIIEPALAYGYGSFIQ